MSDKRQQSRQRDWTRVAFGFAFVAMAGTIWYIVYQNNKREQHELRNARRRSITFDALSECPGKKFPVSGAYDPKKDAARLV